MNRWLRVAIACLTLAVVPVLRADDDPVRAKLDQAKAVYEADVKKARAAVAAYFDKREEVARQNMDKKAVDLVKAERQAFEEKGELPKSAPVGLKAPFATNRSTLEAAYKSAIGEYVKAKKDEDAAVLEKELAGLQLGNPAAVVSLDERIAGKVYATSKGQYEFKRDGSLLIAGKKVGSWSVIGGDRVVSVIDEGQHFDVYVFNKDGTTFQASYIGQAKKEVGIVGKATRDK
jgi:hypothetical protein